MQIPKEEEQLGEWKNLSLDSAEGSRRRTEKFDVDGEIGGYGGLTGFEKLGKKKVMNTTQSKGYKWKIKISFFCGPCPT